MCIRDRPKSTEIETPLQEVLEKRQGVCQDFAHVMIGSLRSVSYTHLRAHETVLDLVCRLLLEKKKIINYYNRY